MIAVAYRAASDRRSVNANTPVKRANAFPRHCKFILSASRAYCCLGWWAARAAGVFVHLISPLSGGLVSDAVFDRHNLSDVGMQRYAQFDAEVAQGRGRHDCDDRRR